MSSSYVYFLYTGIHIHLHTYMYIVSWSDNRLSLPLTFLSKCTMDVLCVCVCVLMCKMNRQVQIYDCTESSHSLIYQKRRQGERVLTFQNINVSFIMKG